MIEVYIGREKNNKRRFDCDDDIEIVRQVMDIFDISVRTVDYSKVIKAPKTANNREILEGLGFSDSDFPFNRFYADVYANGILIMQNAFVKAKETAKEYSINFVSDSKEIWKVIANDTLDLLDFQDANHTKSSTIIKNQWETGIQNDTKFFYFLADYGGQLPSSNTVNGKYLIPSYRIPYLVSKIESKYNVKFNLSENTKLKDTFITFSDANDIEETDDKVVHQRNYDQPTKDVDLERYIIEEDGIYTLEIIGWVPFGIKMEVWLGGYYYDSGSQVVNINAQDLNLKKNAQISYKIYGAHQFLGSVKITRKAVNISGNNAFKNFKTTDFLKEIIYQSAGIPIKHREKNEFDFITLKDIIENEAEDWSMYFNAVENEQYIIGKYGQNNFFRYKYEEKEDSNKDGVFKIDNLNLETNEDVIKSTFYNTPITPSKFSLGGTDISSQQYQLWKRTAQQNNGTWEEKYQPLSGRMFLLTGESKTTTSNFNITVNSTTATTNKVIVANNENYNFQSVINRLYTEFSKILQRPKIIKASFNLPIVVFANFDFKRRIYIKQLGGYFIINKLPWKPNKLTSIELIRANIKVEKNNATEPEFDFKLFFMENNSTGLTKTVVLDNTYKIAIMYFELNDSEPVELLINDNPYPFIKNSNIIEFDFNYPIDFQAGIYNIKLMSNALESNVIRLSVRKQIDIIIIPPGGGIGTSTD